MSRLSPIGIVIGALMVFTVFPIRQYARNWMAVKLGDDTPLREGKLTLNPLAHVDPVGVIFMILIGFGWGRSATINPGRFKCKNRRLGMLAVALAGPVSNLLFAFIMAVATAAAQRLGAGSTAITVMVTIMSLNINLAVFLLLPVPGFDGGDIVMMFLPPSFIWKIGGYLQYISLAMIFLILFTPLKAIVNYPISAVTGLIVNAAYALTSFIG